MHERLKPKLIVRFTNSELKKVGVRVQFWFPPAELECSKCGRTWPANIEENGILPAGYWLCPKGCNSSTGKMRSPNRATEIWWLCPNCNLYHVTEGNASFTCSGVGEERCEDIPLGATDEIGRRRRVADSPAT